MFSFRTYRWKIYTAGASGWKNATTNNFLTLVGTGKLKNRSILHILKIKIWKNPL